MTADALKAQIDAGASICNVGHWSKGAAAWVSRAYRAGKLSRVMDYTYPTPRYRYSAA